MGRILTGRDRLCNVELIEPSIEAFGCDHTCALLTSTYTLRNEFGLSRQTFMGRHRISR